MSKVPENTIDPMEYIPYKLPRDPRKKNERGVYVGVNKLRLFVPYSQTVMIPRCVAKVLDHSAEQDNITANRIMDLENRSNYWGAQAPLMMRAGSFLRGGATPPVRN